MLSSTWLTLGCLFLAAAVAQSSGGSAMGLSIAAILLGAASVAELARYTSPLSLPTYLSVPLCLSVFLPLSIVVLVPVDLAAPAQSERARLIIWRFVYWSAFILTWAILPVLQYYVESGYHAPLQRFKDALQAAAKYQLVLLGVGAAGLFYISLSIGLTFASLKAVAVALSYSYALVIMIWLLGHGLLKLPMSTWFGTTEHRLHSLYLNATATCDEFADAEANYEDAAARVVALVPVKTTQYAPWIDALVADVRTHNLPCQASDLPRRSAARPPSASDLSDAFIANISYTFHRMQSRAVRYRAEWESLLLNAAFYEDILLAKRTGNLELRYAKTMLPPRAAYYYYCVLDAPIKRTGAFLFAVLSLTIIWSELFPGTRLSLVHFVQSSTEGVALFTVTTLLLGYMCLAAMKALTDLRVFNLYALVYRETDASSLTFFAMYACRLVVPLTYNFLQLNTIEDKTVFQQFLGQYVNLTPLGGYFSEWLPRLIVVPVILAYTGFYQRVKEYFGYGTTLFDEEESFSLSKDEGKTLVNQALSDDRFKWALANLYG